MFTTWIPAMMVDAMWLGAGLLAGGTVVAVWHRYTAWRAEQAMEWDPY